MNTFASDRQTTIPLYERLDLLDPSERDELIHMIDFARNNPRLIEQLRQLHKSGPVWDGDVVSKAQRDGLLDCGACAKVIVKGEQGFNACTYFGHGLLRIYEWFYGAKA